MALITRPTPVSSPQGAYEYNSEFLKWLAFVHKIPLLASILAANVDAVFSSWRTTGTKGAQMAEILDAIEGNGKEEFIGIMKNLLCIAKIGGDSYAEIVYDSKHDIENLITLPPDNIRQVIKNGRITQYKESNGDATWKPESIFHLAYNRIGSAPHGHSVIEPMNNLLIHFMQVQDDMARLFHRYIKPLNVFTFKTDSSSEITSWMNNFRAQMAVDENDIGIPAETVEKIERISAPQGSTFDPKIWHDTLINQFLMSNRVSENILGIGTQNSEESARMQMAGFAQLVRSDQKFCSWNCKRQLFVQQFPRDTPSIRFSFAIEPQDEEYKRLQETIQMIEGSSLPPELKSLLEQKILIKMGLIEDV